MTTILLAGTVFIAGAFVSLFLILTVGTKQKLERAQKRAEEEVRKKYQRDLTDEDPLGRL